MAEERDQYLDEEEDIRLGEIREENWRDVAEEGDDNELDHCPGGDRVPAFFGPSRRDENSRGETAA